LKLFVDNNIDEKSTILKETTARFKNVEIETGYISGELTANVYKFYDGFSDDTFSIVKDLPGHDKDINTRRHDKK